MPEHKGVTSPSYPGVTLPKPKARPKILPPVLKLKFKGRNKNAIYSESEDKLSPAVPSSRLNNDSSLTIISTSSSLAV